MKKNKKIILIICVFFIALSGILYMSSDSIGRYISEKNISKNRFTSSAQSYENIQNSNLFTSEPDFDSNSQNANGKIAVYICGAVKKPGVYKFEADSRVCDAIKAADGFKKGAAKTAINQARRLEDGEQINIPTAKQLRKKAHKSSKQQTNEVETSDDEGLININTASASELTSLSGIGSNRAEAIVEYRETNGGFKDISVIMEISGIK